ncbi:MAG: PAS domain-containing protein [Candidatus Limnocylindrales bacterium]
MHDAPFLDAPIGLGLLDTGARYVRVNRALGELDGVDLAAHVGHRPWELVPALAIIRPAAERALAGDDPGPELDVAVGADADPRWWRCRLRVVRDGDAIIGLTFSVRDATDAVRSRAALEEAVAAARETSHALGALIDASPVPIIAYDLDGRVTRWSAAAERTFGWKAAEVLGKSPPTVTPERHGDYLAQLRATAEGRGLRRYETERRTRDGRVLAALVSTAPLRDASGTVRGTIALVEDDTARREAGRRSRQLRDLAAALAATLEPQEVANTVLRLGLPALDASEGVVALMEDDAVRVLASTELGPRGLRAGSVVPLDAARPVAWVARTSQPIVGNTPELRAAHGEILGQLPFPFGALAVLPLSVNERVVGVLGVAFPEPRGLSPADRQFLDTIAGWCAQALDRARLYEAERAARAAAERESQFASALAGAAAALSAAVGPDDVLRAIHENVLPAAGALFATVRVLDQSGSRLVALASPGPPDPDQLSAYALDAQAPIADAVRLGHPVLLSNATERDARYPQHGRRLARRGAAALAAVPLVVGDRPIGGLALAYDQPRRFDVPELRSIQTLADACAQALDRARLYEEARTAERTLAEVVRQMPVGVILAEAPSGRIVFGNQEAERIWSVLPATALLGDAAWQALHLDGRPYEPEEWPIARAVERGETVVDEELEIRRADRSRIAIALNAGPVRDERGRVVAGVATCTDITERRQAEAVRDAFIGVISHELRTPITAIYGGATLLLRPERRLNPETRNTVLEDIAIEAERLNHLVENTLVLARAERGAVVGGREPLLLQHLLARIVAAELAARPDQHIELKVAPRLPAVAGDEGYVEQIVHNLLANAAKYGPPGATITLTAEQAGDEVRVRVLDQGPGIGSEDPEALFTLFYRSPRTIRIASGAGIGLFVVRQLAQAMGGRAWAAQRPEGGAEFGFALRVLDEDGAPADPERR